VLQASYARGDARNSHRRAPVSIVDLLSTTKTPTRSAARRLPSHLSRRRLRLLLRRILSKPRDGARFSRAHFSTSRWPPRREIATHVHSSHGQRSRAPTVSTSRWPPSAAYAHVLLVPRAAVLARPLQHLEVAALAAYAHVALSTGSRSRAPTSAPRGGRPRAPRARARLPVPRAAVLARPLQRLEVAALRRVRARQLVPRAAVLARPLQDLEVAALRRAQARPRVPRAVRSRAPTSAPRGGRPTPRSCTCTSLSHGQPFSRAHFSTSRWPPSPRTCTCTCPTGSRCRAPTAGPRGGRPSPRRSTSPRQSHGQPFSRSHFSTSRWPPRRGSTCLSPRAVVLARPLQHLEVAALRRVRARPRSTGSRLAQPLQHLQLAAPRRVRARPLVPRAVPAFPDPTSPADTGNALLLPKSKTEALACACPSASSGTRVPRLLRSTAS